MLIKKLKRNPNESLRQLSARVLRLYAIVDKDKSRVRERIISFIDAIGWKIGDQLFSTFPKSMEEALNKTELLEQRSKEKKQFIGKSKANI